MLFWFIYLFISGLMSVDFTWFSSVVLNKKPCLYFWKPLSTKLISDAFFNFIFIFLFFTINSFAKMFVCALYFELKTWIIEVIWVIHHLNKTRYWVHENNDRYINNILKKDLRRKYMVGEKQQLLLGTLGTDQPLSCQICLISHYSHFTIDLQTFF